jgi:hypothetical protein
MRSNPTEQQEDAMNRLRWIFSSTGLIFCLTISAFGEPGPLSVHGVVDMDVAADMHGNVWNNDDNTVTLGVKFSETVSGFLGATIITGKIPAGAGNPSGRWPGIAYDGAWLTWKLKETRTITAGDLVYQFGRFNYYFLKTRSMLSAETFLRGAQLTAGLGTTSLDVFAGSKDADRCLGYAAAWSLPMGENTLRIVNSLDSYYGLATQPIMAGASFTGAAGKLKLKMDAGWHANLDNAADAQGFNLLLEPTLTISDQVSVAAALYGQAEKNNYMTGTFGFDDWFVYVEPGYAFTPGVALGLPLELHEPDIHAADDEAFWLVPTLYLYPADKTQWWLWGQMVAPLAGGDPEFYVGSELIYSF